MRVEHYVKDDGAYIYLREVEEGGVARTEHLFTDGIDLDFDHEGHLVGIGVERSASHVLPADLLASAERV